MVDPMCSRVQSTIIAWLIQCVVESNQPFLAPSLAQITQVVLIFKNLKQGYKVGFFFNLWLGRLL